MLNQTAADPCFSCKKTSCVGCKHELQRGWETISENFPAASEMDTFIENLWRESEDICYVNDESVGDLLLDQPFHGFPVGEFTQDDWLRFVDEHHSKGVGWVYDNITPV